MAARRSDGQQAAVQAEAVDVGEGEEEEEEEETVQQIEQGAKDLRRCACLSVSKSVSKSVSMFVSMSVSTSVSTSASMSVSTSVCVSCRLLEHTPESLKHMIPIHPTPDTLQLSPIRLLYRITRLEKQRAVEEALRDEPSGLNKTLSLNPQPYAL